MSMGEYEVTGKREYRGHSPGSVFQARIPAGPAGRAIARGDIRFIREVTPELQSGWHLPDGWGNVNHDVTSTSQFPEGRE